jgi:demethylmenaquinone methyltransferase/2-methoxy-6-polyprenyl-1,4-benzoquinol methylase
MPKRSQIETMFDHIALKYDLLNNILSFGTHWLWKKRLVRKVLETKPATALDGATGTGDIARLIAKKGPKVTGIDISQNMLNVAISKKDNICYKQDDLTSLSFSDNDFDVSCVSFGVRNVEDLEKCMSELARVTKNAVYILEFGQPQNKFFKWAYFKIMKLFIPITGMLFQDKDSYEYLISSSEKFPCGEKFFNGLNEYYQSYSYEPVFGGVAYLYTLYPNLS